MEALEGVWSMTGIMGIWRCATEGRVGPCRPRTSNFVDNEGNKWPLSSDNAHHSAKRYSNRDLFRLIGLYFMWLTSSATIVETREGGMRNRRRSVAKQGEGEKKGAVADGTLVVQFASASGELRKRYNDGVTVRSKMSCAGQRKKRGRVVMPKPAAGSSSAERSISVKQKKNKEAKLC